MMGNPPGRCRIRCGMTRSFETVLDRSVLIEFQMDLFGDTPRNMESSSRGRRGSNSRWIDESGQVDPKWEARVFEALPRRKGPSSERLASIRSYERWLATRQFAGLCGVVGMVVSVWRWWFAEPWIGRGWKVRVTTSTATSAASTASARFVAQIRSRPWYHPTRASCQHSSFNPSYDRILFSFLFNPSIVIIRAKMDSVVASYQVSCRPRGQRPVGMEIEVVRTVIWTLRDKGGWSRLNNHVEGPLLPHFRPHLDSHLRHLIPCSPLSRNCRYSNLNKYHPRTIISSQRTNLRYTC